jgi:DNA mismatch endonuclease (patch repair protein)
LTGDNCFDGVPERTRKVMQANKGRGTRPEIALRKIIYEMGYRYRLNRGDLPGTPDIAFIARRRAVFVHGCFWHAHDDPACKLARQPKTHSEFWEKKFKRNRERDARSEAALRSMGWDVMVVWECRLRSPDSLMPELMQFLGPTNGKKSSG